MNYTTGQIAKQLNLNVRTVIAWIDKGLLKAFKLPGRGDHRIAKKDYIKFLQEQEIPLPEELVENKVLVIEDVPDQAKVISKYLESAGYEVAVSHNGFEIGEKLASFSPRLITLDLNMPGVSGYEVIAYLKNHPEFSKIPVVIITSTDEKKVRKKLDDDEIRILEKPVKKNDLIACITTYL